MSSKYDPFTRGPFPVGVRTQELNDKSRERKLPVEFWYPTTEEYKGRDLDRKTQDKYFLFTHIRQEAVRDAQPQKGRFPLVLFSHGFGGHRRQTTHLCCHLASHGYIVASPDHMGNTALEMVEVYMNINKEASLKEMSEISLKSALNRPIDISFLIDNILTGNTWVSQELVNSKKIGITGHSFGGWTTIVATSRDNRIRAALPLAPGGGDSSEKEDDSERPESDLLGVIRKFWDRKVGILYLAAEYDHLVPLKAVIDLYNRTPEPKQIVVLNNADHFHFNDAIEQIHEYTRTQLVTMSGNNPEIKSRADSMQPISKLHPSKGAYEYIRGLGLAHIDYYLKEKNEAKDFLASDLKSLLAERQIDVSIY